MRKRIISLILVLAVCVSFAVMPIASAHTATAAAQPDGISVTIDGERVHFPGQQPVIVDGRTLVPVRGVFEQLGFEVNWVTADPPPPYAPTPSGSPSIPWFITIRNPYHTLALRGRLSGTSEQRFFASNPEGDYYLMTETSHMKKCCEP